MPKPKPWTPTEDAIIRENADMGPSWEGYALLLPGRSKTAIMSRRQKLGVQFEIGGARKSGNRKKVRKTRHALPDTIWTDEENEALVRSVVEMTERTNHTARECVVQFARIIKTYRKQKGMQR